ncbi:MAG: hypothetical protein ACTIOA_07315 [Brachybacterium tyrofermentans]|uniref:hypothetical protein n=1 Tax=Brachybacterium tyrofermentans TaxID=47848 RepID=UPI000A1A69B0|nr:hypothetical protein FM103_13970 [Corynebacterium xerosis]
MPADVSQLRDLTRDLQAFTPKVAKGIPQVVKKGALNIKKTMQSDFRGSRHFGHIARTISFDVTASSGDVEAEIGPDKSRGGGAKLAHIAYWGGSRGGGASVRDPAHALEAEGDNFENALVKLLDGVL